MSAGGSGGSGAPPLSQAAAKVAAGRKKLEEYKMKKCNGRNEEVVVPVKENVEIVENVENGVKGENGENGENGVNSSEDERVSTPEFLQMKRQVQIHSQTVEFLVSEKSALDARNRELESTLANMRALNEDLSARLNISRHRASCLEMEHSKMREKMDELGDSLARSQLDNSKYQTQEASHNTRHNSLKEELQETKLLANEKIAENAQLTKRLQELTFHINANDLRLQQLSNGNRPQPDPTEDNRDQIVQLTKRLNDTETEMNRSNMQYQQYVQQLNNQLESMSQKQEALLLENENLMNRESNLIQQMDSLEKQLQGMMRIPADPDSDQNKRQDNDQLQQLIKRLENENNQLKSSLTEKDQSLNNALAKINDNQLRIQQLNDTVGQLQFERPDVSKLNAANESDRIAAQKATAQNGKLKIELQSLEEAYKKMTESKLELAELLQAEKNLTKTLTLTMADNEDKVKDIHSKLLAKDEEMIRLQAQSSELEKEALKHAQVMDRLNHYEAQSQSSDVVQKELEFARNMLRTKDDEINKLRKALSKTLSTDSSNTSNDEQPNDDTNESELTVEYEEKIEECQVPQNEDPVKLENCIHIPATEAMKKLQDRFTKLMDDVANLSDDKQRLEHLVLQLQGETETIGEYIALYQRQRSILKQREYEKDIQLNLLTEEKLQMKKQLDQLNALIQQLIRDNVNRTILPPSQRENDSKVEEETASKIVSLLEEIKSSHLIDPARSNMLDNNFHPCPWCSGNLITV